MRKPTVVHMGLVIAMLTMIIIIFSLLLTRNNYIDDTADLQKVLSDPAYNSYFDTKENETVYFENGVEQTVILKDICIDCENSVANMQNSSSMLIVEAPKEICDVDIERCVLYKFDPFGLGIFKKQEILRSKI